MMKTNDNDQLPGYPEYPESEDIYNKLKEEADIEPDDLTKKKSESEQEKPELTDGSDLDVPGSELDDEQESIGNEDEENNFYSLASDEQNDPEEEDTDTKTP